jgi:hypothetical protein
LPAAGSILFLVLFIASASAYPGGTYSNPASVGYSWTENYWCNLLSEKALNGAPNTARPLAYAACTLMALSLAAFWILFPKAAGMSLRARWLTAAAGVLSMIFSFFLPTPYHDTIVNVSAGLGLIAMGGVFVGLKRCGWTRLYYYGLVIVGLVGLNNLFYHNDALWPRLPLVQKATMLYLLGWICAVCLRMYMADRPTPFAAMGADGLN